MANLLHRLLRGRHGPDEDEPVPAPAGTASELGNDAADPAHEPSQAKPKPSGRGPRKTRDEISSIGPGEP